MYFHSISYLIIFNILMSWKFYIRFWTHYKHVHDHLGHNKAEDICDSDANSLV